MRRWGVASFAVAAAACASGATSEQTEDIIGGVPATSPLLDGVGALLLESATIPRHHFCTGTLIAPTKVLTAKHCAIFRPDGQDHYFTEIGTVSFAIGPKASEPMQLVTATRADATRLAGGISGFGSDVAIYTLSRPVADVTPLPISPSPLTAADVSRSFTAIGYGVQNAIGTSGIRTAGSITLSMLEGAPYTAAYTWIEFKARVEGVLGRPLSPQEEAEVRTMYERPLLTDHEAFFAAKDGDVQPCTGDSGGPLLRRVNNRLTVFGVASWASSKATTNALCARGVTYATFGSAAMNLLDEDACGEPIAGRCAGSVAIRCLSRQEGGPRVTQMRCADLGLTCRVTKGLAGCEP
jgi:hypothetical protein